MGKCQYCDGTGYDNSSEFNEEDRKLNSEDNESPYESLIKALEKLK